MKRLTLITILFVSISNFLFAQWTTSGTVTSTTNSIGIGTANPNQVFDVTGTGGSFSTTGKANAAFIQDHINYRGIYLGYDSSDQIGIIGSSTPGVPSNLAFWNYGSTGWFEAMRLTSKGYLGIGTTAPQGALHVNGMSVFAGNWSNLDNRNNTVSLNFLANTGQMVLGWNRTRGDGETDFIANQGAGPLGGFSFYNHDNSNNENQLLYIRGDGNVAIGTSDPKGYKLAVNGSVIATSVTIKSYGSWPDYVFKSTYKLKPLAEVKDYIDKNQHLPEIPSAEEIEKNGLNLGEMNKLLMKKVEELTLYLIEKDKVEKEQKKINQNYATQIEKLTKHLELLTNQLNAFKSQTSNK
ncbi:hypothetical protein [Mucilaginibacter rubeus]|uniref:BZIP transcription factor n=1 Tax=Mucilaginibacter rubeus TaxID=2027860 RepID=A0A5C1HU15_9SPHI|nr:hypothetical protein [Mucilaginibacter rubeus]QEM09115.1 hypothetical protein DEO27_003480 [Mucilaginibacter rubeus]